MIKAVLFDYFGVVASSAYWNNIKQLEKSAGRHQRFHELADKVNMGKLDWPKFCSEIAADLGLNESEVEERYNRHSINRQVVALAKQLSHKYVVGLASNAHYHLLRPQLEATGLDSIFSPILLSSELGAVKPSADFYKKAISSLQLPADSILLIDDMAVNVDGARAYGMHGLVFKTVSELEKDLSSVL